MPVDVVLYNTKLCIHGELVEAGLAIDDGKIIKIGKVPNLPVASKTVNLNGNITLPGLIDSHVHLRDQQLAYKEDFFTGTASAAAGGVTSVIDMPNNNPVTFSSFSLKERIELSTNKILVNVGFNSAFPGSLKEISEIVAAGAIGFKIYLSNKIGGVDVDDDQMLFAAFREAMKNNVPVAVHAEDRKIIEDRKTQMEKAGRNDAKAYLVAHPPEAEAHSIQRIIPLLHKSGVHVHFCHISSALGFNSVLMAKNMGLPVTCEVTPHNLFLSSDQYRPYGNLALTDPPLRTKRDVSVLWSALKNGFINVIASDHAPHSFEEKNVASVWDVKPGVPGLETTLPLLLTQINEGRLSLSELMRVTAEEPARIFHLSERGCLAEGNWADLVVIDMKREHKIDASTFFSKAKYSPFDGMNVKGKALKTFVNGCLVMDDGEIVSSFGSGRII